MALKQNNAEGQAPGTIIAAAQSGSGDSFTAVTPTGSPNYVYDNAQSAHGSQSYYFTGSSGDKVNVDFGGGAGQSAMAARLYIRFASLTAGTYTLVELRNTSGAQVAAIGINSGNQLIVLDAATTLYTFTGVAVVDTWYRLELQAVVGASITTGTVRAQYYLGDSTTPVEAGFTAATANTTTTAAANLRFGKLASATTVNSYIDDIAVNFGSSTAIGAYGSTTLPDAPTGISAAPGNAQAIVTYETPASDGGSIITGYVATSSPAGITSSVSGATASPIVVAGLTNGTPYTFTVRATNANGDSAESSASLAIIPSATYGTLKQNNAEGRANGVAIAAAQSGSGDVFSAVTVVAGAPTYVYDNSQYMHGSQSYLVAGNSSDQVRIDFSGSGVAASAFRAYVRFASLPSAATDLFQIRNTGGQMNAGIGMNSTGNLQVKDNAATLYTMPSALSVDTWYRIELQATVGDGTGTVSAAYYLGDSTTPVGSPYVGTDLHTTATNASLFRFGKLTTATAFQAYFDDIAWNYGSSNVIGPYSAPANQVPSVGAGSDQPDLEPYTTVTLMGSDSDGDGTIVTRTWSQLSGSPAVSLVGSGTTRTYSAPGTIAGTTLVFGYQVTDDDGAQSSQSTVTHTVFGVTERAAVGGVEVPVNTQAVSGGSIDPATRLWTVQDGSLVRRAEQTDNFVLGVTKPDASNTGVPTGTTFATTVTSDVTYSTTQTITDTDFACHVTLTAPVNFVNCRFRGRASGWAGKYGLVTCTDNGAIGSTFERCTFNPDTPYWWMNAIYGQGFTANRCDVSATVDGFHVRYPGTVTITGNYLHDFYFSDQSTDQAGSDPDMWTHNDGIQFRQQGASVGQHLVKGNNFYWYPGLTADDVKYDRNAVLYTGVAGSSFTHTMVSTKGTGRPLWGSSITCSPDFGAYPTGVLITENWFEGGTTCFQSNYASPLSFGEISHNRIGGDQYQYSGGSYQLRWASSVTVTNYLTNTWDDLPTVAPAWRGQALTLGQTGVGNSGGIQIT